jgi:hypothetical protein
MKYIKIIITLFWKSFLFDKFINFLPVPVLCTICNVFCYLPARKEERKPLDVGFLVDSSSDISGANWNHIINFLVAMVDGIDNVSPAPSGTRFGLISFASSPLLFFKFNALTGARLNVEEVKKLVRNTPRQPGSSRRFDHALQSAERELFSNAGGARVNAQKVTR